jgi:uncharacterized protein (TIGR02271 family)
VHTGRPEWGLVTSGLFGTRSHFVPLAGAQPDGEAVRVAATKDQVKNAPGVEGEGQLSEDDERRLFEHYSVPYTDEGSVTAQGAPSSTAHSGANGDEAQGGATGHDTSGPNTDDAMTRSEEELRVGTERRETGRARLRKYVVTETEQRTVPVRREEVRVEREPITEANAGQALDGPEISEDEHEVVLHEERPVVEKDVVAKERVRLSAEERTDEETVSEDLRKERIETDGDTPA